MIQRVGRKAVRFQQPIAFVISLGVIAGLGLPAANSAEVKKEARIAISTIQSSAQDGLNGAVEIRVGKSKPFIVMLDTGSVGLRLFPQAPTSGLTSKALTSELPTGENVAGKLGRAAITVGRTQTTQRVDYQLINSTNAWIDGWQNEGVFGILGIGLKRSPIPNPLRFMPRGLNSTWSINFNRTGRGQLILGDSIPTGALMHFDLPADGVSAPNNPYWDDHAAQGCWSFAPEGSRVRDRVVHCVDTWFDSGFPIMRIKGKQFAKLDLMPSNSLKAKTVVRLAPEGSAFARVSFLAGEQGSRNTTRVVPRGRALINTGNSFFFKYRIYYNNATGDIYLDDLLNESEMN
jgi:hypothetical protein